MDFLFVALIWFCGSLVSYIVVRESVVRGREKRRFNYHFDGAAKIKENISVFWSVRDRFWVVVASVLGSFFAGIVVAVSDLIGRVKIDWNKKAKW